MINFWPYLKLGNFMLHSNAFISNYLIYESAHLGKSGWVHLQSMILETRSFRSAGTQRRTTTLFWSCLSWTSTEEDNFIRTFHISLWKTLPYQVTAFHINEWFAWAVSICPGPFSMEANHCSGRSKRERDVRFVPDEFLCLKFLVRSLCSFFSAMSEALFFVGFCWIS